MANEMSWTEVPVEFHGSEIYAQTPEGEALRRQFREWRKEQNVFYYARPRESFSVREAQELAEKAKADFVLMEDLS